MGVSSLVEKFRLMCSTYFSCFIQEQSVQLWAGSYERKLVLRGLFRVEFPIYDACTFKTFIKEKMIEISMWLYLKVDKFRSRFSVNLTCRFTQQSQGRKSFLGNGEKFYFFIYLRKVVISVRLFICHIITQEPLDRFASNFDWGTRKIHGNVLRLVLRFFFEWVGLNGDNLVSR